MTQLLNSSWLKLIALALAVGVLAFSLGELPAGAGKIDYRAYWSASYLLGQGENFADDDALQTIQRTLTDFERDFAMKTWNPPWVLAWLLPYTWVSFNTATNLWLLTNIGFLFFSVIASWQLLFPTGTNDSGKEAQKKLWIPMLVAMFFPSVIVSLLFGQVNLAVLNGIVGFLFFYQQEKDVPAGLMLALTTFKPHLVYLVVPLFFLHALKHRRWRMLAAFFGALVASTAVVLFLRPTFFTDYFQGTVDGNLLAWEAASLVSYLASITGWIGIRLIGIVLLPLVIIIWFYQGGEWKLMTIAQVGILASLITMPFGWSYDFVVLLLPMTQVIVWLVTKQLSNTDRKLIIGTFTVVYVIYFVQRVATPSELFFFWVPPAIAAIYAWATFRVQPQSAT